MGLIQEDKIRSEALAPYRVYCKDCGHSMIIAKQEKALCSWCGHWVFKDKKVEFKYRLKEQLLKK